VFIRELEQFQSYQLQSKRSRMRWHSLGLITSTRTCSLHSLRFNRSWSYLWQQNPWFEAKKSW